MTGSFFPRMATSDLRLQESGSGVAAQDVPAPALTPEEEFDFFGPSEDQNLLVQRIVEQQVLCKALLRKRLRLDNLRWTSSGHGS